MSSAFILRESQLPERGGPVCVALARLLERARNPRALMVRPEDDAALRRAAERAAAQLHAESDCVLTIALAGGSGVGKSTLINALAGGTIAEAAEQRPCTMQSTIYHHRAVPGGGLPAEIASQSREVAHDRPELRLKVVVDTPDLDTFATHNRAATRALLKAAGLVIYVFTPEKYWDERVWSVIREEQRFSACLAVLNKADLVPPEALERAADEIRRRFGELGKPDISVLRVCAERHVPRADGLLPPSEAGMVDEFPTLRAYIEHELREGDIARMRRDQRVRVVENLGEHVERLLPDDFGKQLDALESEAGVIADTTADQVSAAFAERLAAVEAEAAPLVAMRRHQAFHGPFRVWLSLCDLFSYGVPRLLRRLRTVGGSPNADIAAMLGSGPTARLDETLVRAGSQLRDTAFSRGLPVERWRAIVEHPGGSQLLCTLGDEVQARFDEAASTRSLRLRIVAQAASLLGTLIPLALAGYALIALVLRLWSSQTAGGLDMLTLVLALTVLAYALLHAAVNLALLGLRSQPMRDAGRRAIHTVLQRTLGGWVATYRADLESDAAELRASVGALRSLALSPLEPPREPAREVSYPIGAPVPPHSLRPGDNLEPAGDVVYSEPAHFVPETSPAIVVEAPSQPATHPDTALPASDPEGTVPQPSPVPPRRPADIFRQAVERHAAASQAAPKP